MTMMLLFYIPQKDYLNRICYFLNICLKKSALNGATKEEQK
jgi:hypothetical protein